MTNVLVQTPGTHISARAGRLLLQSEAKEQVIPLGHVTELTVIGHARISTAAVIDLAQRGIPVHFQSHADQLPFSVWGTWNGSLEALQQQFSASATRRLDAAKALIAAKIENSQWVLRRLQHPGQLPKPDMSSVTDSQTLRGLEGQAAKVYFSALGELLPGWQFERRLYHPCPDPVNAALSFAYSLLLRHVLSALHQAGLHAALGTLHVSHGRRPALALDLMEPFRAPLCDLTVLSLLRSGQLPSSGFEQRMGEVRLGKAGCHTLNEAFQEKFVRWRVGTGLRQQVQAVQAAWRGEECPCWHPPVRP